MYQDVKLILSDVDGTLIQDYDQGLDKRLFEQILALKEKGIHFCIASGRQYASLKRLFAPVWREIYFIAENGGAIFYRDECIETIKMEYDQALEMAAEIQNHPCCEVLVSTPRLGYYHQPSFAYQQALAELNGFDMQEVDNWNEIPDEIIKVTAFVLKNPKEIQADFASWSNEYQVAVAGPDWIDVNKATKGLAAQILSTKLGLSPDQTISFGDMYNDIDLLQFSPHSMAMQHALADIKAASGGRVCSNVSDILDEIIKENESIY